MLSCESPLQDTLLTAIDPVCSFEGVKQPGGGEGEGPGRLPTDPDRSRLWDDYVITSSTRISQLSVVYLPQAI